jgi:high-affinity iron transporter
MLAAAVIVFREVIEAGLIIGIVLAASAGVPRRGRMVALGAIGGLAGAGLVALFAGAIGAMFEGAGQELLQAAVLAIAVGMLAWHNAWMASHGRQMAREMRTLGEQVRQGSRPLAALAIVIGVAVLREGSEVVLFLAGVAASSGAGAFDILAGVAIGVAGGGALATIVYRGLLAIPTARLFSVTGWLITLLAAGMASRAVLLLQQGGYAERLTTPLWNSSAILSDGSIPGRMLGVLVGYSDQPNGMQLIAWLATVLGIWLLTRLISPSPARPVAARAG